MNSCWMFNCDFFFFYDFCGCQISLEFTRFEAAICSSSSIFKLYTEVVFLYLVYSCFQNSKVGQPLSVEAVEGSKSCAKKKLLLFFQRGHDTELFKTSSTSRWWAPTNVKL